MFSASTIKLDLIWKSNGESNAIEGDRFTSRIQGFKSESRIISNPNKSKLLDLF